MISCTALHNGDAGCTDHFGVPDSILTTETTIRHEQEVHDWAAAWLLDVVLIKTPYLEETVPSNSGLAVVQGQCLAILPTQNPFDAAI